MWRGFADGRLTMDHCLEEATLFESNLHHSVLVCTASLGLYQLKHCTQWHHQPHLKEARHLRLQLDMSKHGL